MSFLSTHFDTSVCLQSPVQEDFDRRVSYDKDGNEFISYVKTDYPTIQSANGLCAVWNLNALLKAGVNPSFPIHTGNPTRVEGLSALDGFSAAADAILADVEPKNED